MVQPILTQVRVRKILPRLALPTFSWQSMMTGDKLYAPGGTNNTAVAPVNMSTKRDGLIAAYPHLKADLETNPANYSLKSIPTIYYKR